MLYDKDIREPLFDFLEERFGKIRMIEEKQMGRSRADVVMVMPDALAGIEIKSDADTYARLSRQVKDYNRFFDCNMVVVGSTHAAHIKEHVPDWWGIITVELIDDQIDFYLYREMQQNPKVDERRMTAQLSFLWRPELTRIQEMNGMAKYKEKSKAFVIEKIIEKVEPDLLKAQMCEELFERDYEALLENIRQYKIASGKATKTVVSKVKKRRRKRG